MWRLWRRAVGYLTCNGLRDPAHAAGDASDRPNLRLRRPPRPRRIRDLPPASILQAQRIDHRTTFDEGWAITLTGRMAPPQAPLRRPKAVVVVCTTDRCRAIPLLAVAALLVLSRGQPRPSGTHPRHGVLSAPTPSPSAAPVAPRPGTAFDPRFRCEIAASPSLASRSTSARANGGDRRTCAAASADRSVVTAPYDPDHDSALAGAARPARLSVILGCSNAHEQDGMERGARSVVASIGKFEGREHRPSARQAAISARFRTANSLTYRPQRCRQLGGWLGVGARPISWGRERSVTTRRRI